MVKQPINQTAVIFKNVLKNPSLFLSISQEIFDLVVFSKTDLLNGSNARGEKLVPPEEKMQPVEG